MVALISKQIQSISNKHNPGVECSSANDTHRSPRAPLCLAPQPSNTAAGEKGMGRVALSHVSLGRGSHDR